MNTTTDWILLAASLALIAGYEAYVHVKRRTQPMRVARTAHAKIRANWARAIRSKPGHEILAVQTLRNSVMAASITASTAVLAFVAIVSQIVPRNTERDITLPAFALNVHDVLTVLLMATLFVAFILSAVAVRFFNQAGYILATPPGPAGSSSDELTEIGARYVARAGHLYSMGLRSFLIAAPFVVGLSSTRAMVVAAVALVFVLVWFDRPPPLSTPD